MAEAQIRELTAVAGRSTMAEHSFDVAWRFVVPPENTRRVVITQRQDGPFRPNHVGGTGHYYVGLEAYDTGIDGFWRHVPGSALGGYDSYAIALGFAERLWHAAVKAST
jgi:hypothetical protein